VDTSWHIGRRLVETYTVVSKASFPFGVAFQQGSSMFTLAQALAGSGYAGAVDELASVYMAQYTTSGGPLTYLAPSNLVLDEGSFQTRPAKIRRLLADDTFLQATEGPEDILMEAGPTLLAIAATSATHTEQLDLLGSAVAGLEDSMETKVEQAAFGTAISSQEAEVALKADKSSVDLEVARLDAANGALQSAINSTDLALADEVARLDAADTALQTSVAAQDSEISALQGLTTTHDGAIALLQSTVSDLQVQKQDSLAAGGGEQEVLQGNIVRSLAAGPGTTLTGDAGQITIAADVTQAEHDSMVAVVATKAAQAAVDALEVTLAATATQASVDGLAAVVATKASQSQLDFVGQNFQPRITAFEPLSLVPRTDPNNNPFAELSIDLDSYASTPALLAVKNIAEANNQALVDLAPQVEAKQDQLSAGTGMVFHEPLLEANTIKSLVAGNNVSLSSTDDFVTISAAGAQLQGAQFQAPFSVMDQANGTALRARVSETRTEFFTDTEVNGDLQVTGLSQLQGVEAAGVVAEQVVWVTGVNGAPQSVVFPGSLQLGKWRIRGDETGSFYVERFDDDGELRTDDWLTISRFTHNTATNTSRLNVENLTVAGATKLDGIVQVGPSPPAGATVAIAGTLRATGNISTSAALQADTISPNTPGDITVTSELTIDGVTRLDVFKGGRPARSLARTTSP
jgi:hypothetical protein